MRNLQGRKAEVQELLRTGRHVEAGQRLREICAGPHADAESWFFLGVVSGMQGDAAGAENCFRKALVLMPGFLPARFNLGIALRDQGRLDEARIELEAVVAAQPAYAEASNALGYVYVRLERAGDAERCFRAALASNPAFPEALTNLGNVLASQERWSEGMEFYRRALRVAPGYADAALNLGRAMVAQGHLEEAIAAYRAVIASNDANVEAHTELGMALVRAGRAQEAAGEFRVVLAIRPDHAEARQFLAELLRGVLREKPDDVMARYLLDALSSGPNPQIAPAEYVTRLFDEYSESFDKELVGKLHYRVPEALHHAVKTAFAERQVLDVLDLGCGTGLCGALFRPLARTLTGVDLSPKMVAKARDRGVYDHLEVGELGATLRECDQQSLDLVLAADVFVYIGDLAPVFEAAARVLRPEGLFAFSVEAANAQEGESYVLRQTGRFAHAHAYIGLLARRFGFNPVSSDRLCTRLDGGKPIDGEIHVLQRTT